MTRREEWMKEYRKSFKSLKADLRTEERDKLDEIVKQNNITIIKWLRNHIEEDYNNLQKN